jgi:hypothetical protein
MSNPHEAAPLTTVSGVTEFEAACCHSRAVMFVDVDWSVYSRLARRIFHNVVREWHAPAGEPAPYFFRVDATEQEGELFERLCSGGLKREAYAGSGALVLMACGHIQDIILTPSQHTVDDVRQRIEQFAATHDNRQNGPRKLAQFSETPDNAT